ncbi:uncharacterized mitochondrial protein-like protein [Tanacetum coccineum]
MSSVSSQQLRTEAQVDQGSQIKMIQVKEMMQDNDLKNSKSKDKGLKSRSQSMNEQSRYKQDKTITRQSINVKRHIFNVIGDTEKFEEIDLNIGGDYDEDDGVEADINNLNTIMQFSPNLTTRNHKDHPLDQVIGDMQSATQTRNMSKNLKEHGFVSTIQQRTNHKDLQNCLFACFLSQEEPKKVIYALKDPSWIEAMQEELLQFKLQEVWTLVDLPNGKRAIGTKWVFRNKKDEKDNGFQRGKIDKTLFIKRYKGDILLVQVYVDDIIFGSTKKELCNAFEKLMHEKFQMSSMGELTFFLGLQVQQKKDGIFISQDKYVGEILKKFGFIEVKTASTLMETQKPLLKDEDGEEVDVHMYRSMIGSLMYLTSSRPDIMFAVCACARYQVNPKVSHLHAVKRIFRYLKGQPKLGLWYPKDSPFDLVAYTDSDYAGASLDRKSTTGGCQFLGCRLISWQCKKQTVVANSTTEAEYVAASSCCGQVLWIQNQLLDYGDCNEKKLIQMVKIHTDKNVADLLTKAFDAYVVLWVTTAEMFKFWSSAVAKTINGEVQLHALVDGKRIVITETSVRRSLRLADAEGTSSGSGLRCQETIRDTIVQTRFKNVSKLSNDPLLARDEEDLGEDASKQGRRIHDIDADEDITLVNDDNEIFDVDALAGEEVFIVEQSKNIVEEADKVVIQEPEQGTTTTTPTTIIPVPKPPQDKGKGIMIEEHVVKQVKPMKRLEQMRLDEELAFKLQAEEEEDEEEERLAREKAQQIEEANIAWDDVHAKVEADYQLAQRLQAQERISSLGRIVGIKRLLDDLRVTAAQVYVTAAKLIEKLVAVTPMNKDKRVRFVEPVTSSSNILKQSNLLKTKDSNKALLTSTGVNTTTSASGLKPSGNTKKNRISQPLSSNKKNIGEEHPRKVKSSLNKTNSVSEPISNVLVKHSVRNAKIESICVICNKCLFDFNHDMITSKETTITPVITASPELKVYSKKPKASQSVRSSGKSKIEKSKISNTKKPNQSWGSTVFDVPSSSLIDYRFLGTVRFGNDHIAKIMGYGDYQMGNVTISRVYYVEGLGQNLFFVGQFCDLDLEVAFCKHTCFIRDLEVLNPLPCVDLQVPAVIALEPVVSTGTPSSTTIDQDAPSTSTSQTNPETPYLVIPLGVEEADHDIEFAHMDNNPYVDFLISEPSSKESSSQVVIPNHVHSINQPPKHINRWTKYHPINNVIGDPFRPVSTRNQL